MPKYFMNINLLDLMNTLRNLSHQNMKFTCSFSLLLSQFTEKMIASKRVKKNEVGEKKGTTTADSRVCSLRMVKAIIITIKRLFSYGLPIQ